MVSDLVLGREINGQAAGVFDSLLIFLGAMIGVISADKKFVNKALPPPEEPTEI